MWLRQLGFKFQASHIRKVRIPVTTLSDAWRNWVSTQTAWYGVSALCSHWSANFEVTGMTRPRKNPVASGIRTPDLPVSRRTPEPLGQRREPIRDGQCLVCYGTEVRLTECTLVGSTYLPHMERCCTRWKCVISHVLVWYRTLRVKWIVHQRRVCVLLIHTTSLLPTAALHVR